MKFIDKMKDLGKWDAMKKTLKESTATKKENLLFIEMVIKIEAFRDKDLMDDLFDDLMDMVSEHVYDVLMSEITEEKATEDLLKQGAEFIESRTKGESKQGESTNPIQDAIITILDAMFDRLFEDLEKGEGEDGSSEA